MKKRIISFVLALVMCVGLTAPAFATDGSANVRVFQKTFDLNSEEANIIETTVIHTNEGRKGHYTVGSALVAYNPDTDAVFYIVPILDGDSCVGMIHMSPDLSIGVTRTSSTVLYDKVLALPEGDYILYTTGGKFYAESSAETIELQDSKLSVSANEEYLALPYEEKVEGFLSQNENTYILSDTNALRNSTLDIVVDGPSNVQLYTVVPVTEFEECEITDFVSQGNYNLCWAACIATIANFKKGYYLTAIGVAMKKGADFTNKDYEGESVSTITDELNKLGFSYRTLLDKMSWSDVKQNIKNKDPFIAIAHAFNGQKFIAHAVTAYGYSCAYGDPLDRTDERYIIAWNPGSKEKFSFQYNSPIFFYGGFTWAWLESVAP